MWLNWLWLSASFSGCGFVVFLLAISAVIRWYIVGSLNAYKNNFQPFPSTKLCEESCNMVQHHALGHLELRGNLTVC